MSQTTADRMSTLDSGFYFAEHGDVPMHIGSVAVFDGPAPAYQDVMRLFEAKLPSVPRYRQMVRTTPGQILRPTWVDDEHFTIRHHVRHATILAPGGPDQLRAAAAKLFALRLDRRRPLWEEWFLDGLEGGRLGHRLQDPPLHGGRRRRQRPDGAGLRHRSRGARAGGGQLGPRAGGPRWPNARPATCATP